MFRKKRAEANAAQPLSRDEISLLTVSSAPHIKHPDTARVLMADVLIALTPAYIWGIYKLSWRALTLGIISVVACVLFEALTQKVLKRPVTIGDLSAAVTGVLLAMNLPVTAPLWIPVVGAAFAIIVAKQLYGGIGKNIVNPALAARIFLFISFPSYMANYAMPEEKPSPFKITLDAITSASPDAVGSATPVDGVASATPLKAFKSGLLPDESVLTLLIGDHGGSIGELSALLLVAGGIYLLVRRVISWRIPVAYIGTVFILTMLFPKLPLVSDQVALQYALRQILSGGLMLGAIYMATDYTTSPVTPRGRIIYGIGCGAITVFIRYFGGYPEGVSFAILIMNFLVWYIDKFTRPKHFGWTKPASQDKNKKLREGGEAVK
ncbi:MAG: RnfABCDGE type electron transport complex subunit D [Clostridiales bacterium]|nr:RnfABCDGE type electron transport complex subunit D [Clostridiales bacterium]